MLFRREVRDMVRHLVIGRTANSELQLLGTLRHAVEAQLNKVGAWRRQSESRWSSVFMVFRRHTAIWCLFCLNQCLTSYIPYAGVLMCAPY